jgi:hypothetical protein
MLDQDARPEVSVLPDATTRGRSPRGRRGALTIVVAVVAAAALAAVGFLVGRSSDNGRGSGAVTTRPAAAENPSPVNGVTKDTVPTLAFGEAREKQPDKPLDNATRNALAADLVAARATALRYPTVASARAAHLVQAGEFAPGAGAHFLGPGGLRPDGSVDPSRPSAFIYDGLSPDSRIVGLMYSSYGTGNAPKGFPGPNDHWHLHQNVCFSVGAAGISVPFATDRDVTQAECAAAHGTFLKKTTWMVHAWVVPGWESPDGVFAHANTDLRCADGTMHTDKVGFCKGT